MFSWKEYLSLAHVLAASLDNEAAQRSAVSRAYYAAFHAARVLVESDATGPLSQFEGAHQAIWRSLERGPKVRKRIATSGKRLCDYRRQADYENNVAGLAAMVQEVLLEAATLISLAEAALAAGKRGMAPATPPVA
jgi:uncharacterized protein (UPF0332 family)